MTIVENRIAIGVQSSTPIFNRTAVNMNAKPDGRYLFETFPASRDSLAVLPEWNQMTGMRQFQITPGTLIIEGRAASQGSYPGGQVQKFILDPKTGLIPISGK